MSGLRIISGEFRSRRLLPPPGSDVSRPYLSRVRESVFGMLHGWFQGASVLDLFAGVGTMGLEAASRGARSVVMVEQDRRIFKLLQENVRALGCEDRASAVLGDALGSACLARAEAPVDLAFVDPPYALMLDPGGRLRVLAQMARLAPLLNPRGFLILRAPAGPEAIALDVPGLAGPETHRYREDLWVLLYSPQPAAATP
jgi:16S rRNA (guanine966-N2)-methyltransferase